MRVAKLREHVDLGLELACSLLGILFEPFDGDGGRVTRADMSFVHVAEPSVAYD